jgi:hypothetical protein
VNPVIEVVLDHVTVNLCYITETELGVVREHYFMRPPSEKAEACLPSPELIVSIHSASALVNTPRLSSSSALNPIPREL